MGNNTTRNRGGRPEKHKGKKIKQAHVRLTEEQHLQLAKLEHETGLRRTELFIQRVLEGKDYLITKDVINQLSSIGANVGKVGSNINQLAKHANTITKTHELPPKIVEEFNKHMKLFLEYESEINKLFRQMYRTMRG
jgi:hypothetical protein